MPYQGDEIEKMISLASLAEFPKPIDFFYNEKQSLPANFARLCLEWINFGEQFFGVPPGDYPEKCLEFGGDGYYTTIYLNVGSDKSFEQAMYVTYALYWFLDNYTDKINKLKHVSNVYEVTQRWQ